MNIIGRIITEIQKCKVKHNRKPNLILVGEKEQAELFLQNQMKLPLPCRFMSIRMIYTKEENELKSLIY